MRRLLLSCFFIVLAAFPSMAMATPSDLIDEEELINDLYDENGGSYEVQRSILDEVTTIHQLLSAYGLSSPSDALASSGSNPEEDNSGDGFLASVTSFDAVEAAGVSDEFYYNSLRFDVVIDGRDAVLLFPPEYIDYIYIDSADRLWNLSTSTIQGRLVTDGFDPYAESGSLVYMTPCLGNNFSAIRNNGSPNYVRRYYWSGSRLNYDDTYTEIVVRDFHYQFRVSDTLTYILLFLLMGGVLLLWLKNYKRY